MVIGVVVVVALLVAWLYVRRPEHQLLPPESESPAQSDQGSLL